MEDDRNGQRAETTQHPQDMLTRFQYTIEESPEAVFWLEQSGRFSYVNRQACKSLGYTREEMLSLFLWDIDPDYPEARWERQWEDMKKAGKRTFETRHRRKDGHIFPVEVSAFQVNFGGEEFHAAFVRDITARKKAVIEQSNLEKQLQQAQKLEAIGTLAGGIAHDFNNMLSVIIGYSELLKNKIPHGDPAAKDIMEIERAGIRSKDIIRQLLAFSRKQVIAPVSLDLNHRVNTTLKMLGRLIGENIELEFSAQENLWKIELDPSQLDQILINLAVNARDALPEKGGVLRITTSNMALDEEAVKHFPEAAPGNYVLLEVSDNGAGMDKETLMHAFEPFFTTKETGRGTGLGLATVYGIVRQNSGFIRIESQPAQGSSISIYFPKMTPEKEAAAFAEQVPAAPGTGIVLLVEDDDMVRKITARMLEAIGYTVLDVSNPLAAVSFCETHGVSIDLLLTDIVLPQMSGMELSQRIAALKPGIKVLLMSGYSSIIGDRKGILSKGIHFIEKPFGKNDLARKIHEVLRNP